MYQIYPASFKSASSIVTDGDSDSDDASTELELRGDLRGIISQLDYLALLGVDIVWLSPILQSPQVDMGYDISDYRAIYPGYGTMADHDDLIAGLHARGIKYVMDLVVNHTSDQHEWFQQSRSSKDNPYRDWYFWRPPRYSHEGERMPPNNWESAFSGSAWTYDEATGEYYLHLFAPGQPDLNWENVEVVDAVHSLMRFWLARGVDGFRMDVINFISKTPGLPDGNVVQPGFLQSGLQHFACGPRLHEFLQGMGAILREYDAFSVGEMPGVSDTKEILKAVGQERGELAMAFQFDIVSMDIEPGAGLSKWTHRDFDPRTLKQVVAKWQSFMLRNAGWNAVFMENHDQGRSVSRYADDGDDERRSTSAKLLAAHMGLQSGTVFVYQGQELAQTNVPESWGLDRYKDIEVLNHWKTVLRDFPHDLDKQAAFKRQYRLIGRDNARTPMQWTPDAGSFAGFLADDAPRHARPWMSTHPDFASWNAQAQLADPHSVFHYWRRVLRLRKQHKDVFVYGDFDMLDMDHPCVVAYLRTADAADLAESESGHGHGHAGDGADTKRTCCLVLANFSRDRVWWTLPQRAAAVLIDDSADSQSGWRKGAVIDELRNYNDHDHEHGEDGQSRVEKQQDGQWAVALRPWEVIVAMH